MISKNKILIVLLSLSIFSVVCFITVSTKNNKDINKVSLDKFDSTIELLIQDNLATFSEKELLDIEKKSISILETSTDSTQQIISHSTLGYIYNLKDDSSSALKNYIHAISLFDNSTSPKLQAWIMFQVSSIYIKENDYENSDIYFNRVSKICKQHNLKEYTVDIYSKRAGQIINTKDGINKAVKLIDEALDISKEINYDLAKMYSRAGIIYSTSRNLIQGIEYQLQAIELSKKNNLKDLELRTLVDVAINYTVLENYDEAIKYLEQVAKSSDFKNTTDSFFKSYALLNLAETYILKGDTVSAQSKLIQLQESLDGVSNEREKSDTQTYMYALFAQLELKNKNPNKAIEFADIAQELYISNSDKFVYLDFNILLYQLYGDIYYEFKDYDKALEYHKKAQQQANNVGSVQYKTIHAKSIYMDYLALDDLSNATKYMQVYIDAQNDINRIQESQYTQFLYKKFDSERKEIEILELENDRKILSIIVLFLVFLSAIILSMIIYIYRNNKEVKRLNNCLKKLSITDSLTQLYNRRALDDFLSINWNTFMSSSLPISILMIDIDYFKAYNDYYGHLEGDKALKLVANELKKAFPFANFIARYGGEEFTIVLLDSPKEKTFEYISTLQRNLEKLNISNEHSPLNSRLTLSVGVTTVYSDNARDYNYYLNKADEALYVAKNNGRNSYSYKD